MKIFCWNCRGVGNPATVRELKQLLVANGPDIVFLCETFILMRFFSGGLAVMWREGVRVTMLRFTGFYGQADPRLRQNAWDMPRRVKSRNNERWIEGGRKKPKTLMDEFANFLDELNLFDVKTYNGWYTWTNNREVNGLVKERLDRFIVSKAGMERLPFLTSYIRLWFRYDNCWAREKGVRDIITGIWLNREGDMLEKIEFFRGKLSPGKYHHYRNMKNRIKGLEKEISRVIDGPSSDQSTSLLKNARRKLGHLFKVEERYWATRAHF
ncbi:hypothetical protein V6Z12_D05G339400 [Gossypium hirsutum]